MIVHRWTIRFNVEGIFHWVVLWHVPDLYPIRSDYKEWGMIMEVFNLTFIFLNSHCLLVVIID
jgi:hypothetical protein